MADRRPALLHEPATATHRAAGGPASAERQARLETLYSRWEQFTGEYRAARQRNDQELMTNLRGLLLLVKKEIGRLGGKLPTFPYPDEPHLADL
jgi:hypothetical protein